MEKLTLDNQGENFEHRRLSVKNDIQKTVMSFLCSPDEGPACFTNWIDNNGERFDELFKSALDEDPNFLDKWDSNRDSIIDKFVGEFQGPSFPEEKAA